MKGLKNFIFLAAAGALLLIIMFFLWKEHDAAAAIPARKQEPGLTPVKHASNAHTVSKAEFPVTPNAPPPINQGTITGKKVGQDPAARMALKLVGTDAIAESLWIEAINNPGLPASERKDLIEDLNEEGLPDAKHLTMAQLPLIERRLELVERLLPEAMDKTNADAFQEAYKDLIGMYTRLNGQ